MTDATELVATVARTFNVTPADILGPSSARVFCRARWMVIQLLNDRGLSKKQIDEAMGKPTNTASQGLKYARKLMLEDIDWRQTYRRLSKSLTTTEGE